MEYIALQLSDLPDSLHFRDFACITGYGGDFKWVTALVDGCSGTLEYVCVECSILVSRAPSVFAMGLPDYKFRWLQ